MEKLFFQSSLPRSGSTMLQNILAQNTDIYATPTSGVLELIYGARENYSNSPEFVAQDKENLEYTPVKVSDCDEQGREMIKNLIGQQVDDVIGEKSRMSMPRDAESPAQTPNFKKTMYGNPVPSYFGKSLSDDGFADGNTKSAKFSYPLGVAVDPAGNVYVADTNNDRIRKIFCSAK
jgi:DNA-binding beta-propeller fold protein YncE